MAETAEKKILKPGWKTSEFYVSLGGMVVPFLIEHLPATWKAVLVVGAGAIYTVGRALAKIGIGRG